ncbi:MAG: hypothetical protein GTO45_07535 [Candidatus Aminicenantes bacterium]|nr:hypothetical protein [Candidatus Aminicenantes bacterium]NIM78687.1 hypothetical protein [Candidatus Aminicenantes bacterium]NIN17935.1 hypothetical protein [Candidatus Aminicenantes bacterium]NIN41838.1 hypothetical protein [Candidatus Aminicenantes bacterium]NIN84590.1 hypothetical protein [Candidatus Aminicenantes bacterium]
MRKTIFWGLFLTLLFSFFPLANAKEKKKIFVVPQYGESIIQKVDFKGELEQKKRFLEIRDRKQRFYSKISSMPEAFEADKPKAVNLMMDENSLYFQRDFEDDLVMTGLCYNYGTTSAVFVRVDVDLYDINQNYIGSDFTYVWGGSIVQLAGSGDFINALGHNDYGFFKVWTYYDYDDVYWYDYTISYNTYSHTPAKAALEFDGDVYYYNYLGNLDYYGEIKNLSSNYVTYDTYAAFAVFDKSDTQVVDVSFNDVDGSNYGASESAIYPGKSEPFDVWFPEAEYGSTSNSFLYAYEWAEAYVGSSGGDKEPPFGSFDTPTSGSTVAGSVAVTGWALDDTGVESVKIYRKSGGNLVYIGDALFVEGARPDIAQAYPNYPNNTRAGWGYMMLTNFLPNNGNGTFVFQAIATDLAGKTTTLGTKTIRCDNAHATKPFGAIDKPGAGETVSGVYRIKGWVLTPPPNKIPKDGASIRVKVDGVDLGHATYNIYRADIANLFPGYANNNGAGAYFDLDTTQFSDGLHTLEWLVTDNAGNRDGVGSRFFMIDNDDEETEVKYEIFTNPGTSILLKATRDDGLEVEFYGEKDEQGLPTKLTSAAVKEPGDSHPTHVLFDNDGRIDKVFTSNGTTFQFEWFSDTELRITATSPNGELIVSIPYDLNSGSTSSAINSEIYTGSKREINLLPRNNVPIAIKSGNWEDIGYINTNSNSYCKTATIELTKCAEPISDAIDVGLRFYPTYPRERYRARHVGDGIYEVCIPADVSPITIDVGEVCQTTSIVIGAMCTFSKPLVPQIPLICATIGVIIDAISPAPPVLETAAITAACASLSYVFVALCKTIWKSPPGGGTTFADMLCNEFQGVEIELTDGVYSIIPFAYITGTGYIEGNKTNIKFPYSGLLPKFSIDAPGELKISGFHTEPSDPAPYQGYVAKAKILCPSKEGTTVSISVVGTDYYSDSNTITMNKSGWISISVPGSYEGVSDTITVSISGGPTAVIGIVF